MSPFKISIDLSPPLSIGCRGVCTTLILNYRKPKRNQTEAKENEIKNVIYVIVQLITKATPDAVFQAPEGPGGAALRLYVGGRGVLLVAGDQRQRGHRYNPNAHFTLPFLSLRGVAIAALVARSVRPFRPQSRWLRRRRCTGWRPRA